MKWKGRGWTRESVETCVWTGLYVWQGWQNANFSSIWAQTFTHKHTCTHCHVHIYTGSHRCLFYFFYVLHSSLKQPEWSGKEKWQLFMSSLSNEHWLEEIGSSRREQRQSHLPLGWPNAPAEPHACVSFLSYRVCVCVSTSGVGGAGGRKKII